MVSRFGSLGYTIMGKTADLTVQKTIIDTLHKEWTEAGVKASRATTHRCVKEFGYSCCIPLVKPLLNHRQRQRRLTWAKEKKNWTVAQWSKVLFSDESKFCISFGNQGPRVSKVKVKVSFIVNSATCTVHTYRELKLRYSLTPWCIQITLNKQ